MSLPPRYAIAKKGQVDKYSKIFGLFGNLAIRVCQGPSTCTRTFKHGDPGYEVGDSTAICSSRNRKLTIVSEFSIKASILIFRSCRSLTNFETNFCFKMPKLFAYARERVINLYSSGESVTKITKLLQGEGINASRSAVSSFLSRYRRTGSIQDAKRSYCGRRTKLSNDHVKFIDDRMKENDELTSAELREKLSKECHVEVSATTVRRVNRYRQTARQELESRELCCSVMFK